MKTFNIRDTSISGGKSPLGQKPALLLLVYFSITFYYMLRKFITQGVRRLLSKEISFSCGSTYNHPLEATMTNDPCLVNIELSHDSTDTQLLESPQPTSLAQFLPNYPATIGWRKFLSILISSKSTNSTPLCGSCFRIFHIGTIELLNMNTTSKMSSRHTNKSCNTKSQTTTQPQLKHQMLQIIL